MAVFDGWRERIPHRGRMVLIDRVVAVDAGSIRAGSDNHRDLDHPLRHDGILHAVHLCEYGAQAMAVHGALAGGEDGARPGLLVALRGVDLHVGRIDDLPGVLAIHAEREHADSRSWRYRFDIRHDGRLLAEGSALVVLEQE